MFGWWKKQRRLSDEEVSAVFDDICQNGTDGAVSASGETWQAVMSQKHSGLAQGERALMPNSIDGRSVKVNESLSFGDFVIDN